MSFVNFGFKKIINDAIEKIGFTHPTKIQELVMPHLKKYHNLVAQSHTGTGKTHAFLLPILNNLDYEKENKVQFLIIAPTRELARQIHSNIKELIIDLPTCSVGLFVGGEDANRQANSLETKQPMIVVGTPTRIKQLYEANFLRVTTARHVVIDECDMIFDLGFIDELDFILNKMAKDVNISLFSATINNGLKPFLKKYLKNAIFIDNTQNFASSKKIEHILIWTKNKENKQVLQTIAKDINPFLAIIFVNRKDQVRSIIEALNEVGIKNVGELHGDLDPRVRTNMQKRIQNNEFKWIVASDVASRGIDIDGVSHIISIDLPNDLDYYIHRSGRTGRNKYEGKSYVLHNNSNQHLIDELKSKGIDFSNYKLVEGRLVQIVQKEKIKFYNPNSKLNVETKKIVDKYKNNKVKPGYKKKRKAEIEAVKKGIRRDHIKESINKIKKEKYKQRRIEIFGDEEK